jgi:hypothetical protein
MLYQWLVWIREIWRYNQHLDMMQNTHQCELYYKTKLMFPTYARNK